VPLTATERRRIAGLIIGLGILVCCIIVTISTVATSSAPADAGIPRCLSDDFNDGSQPMCYTITVDRTVVVIDSSDQVVS
jgi:hypothetical protein